MEITPINGYAPNMLQNSAASPATLQPQVAPVSDQSVNSSQGAASQPVTKDQTVHAVEAINKTISNLSRGLEFIVDQDTHMTIVKVVDTQTQDVIRQIPSEEAVAIAKALDRIQGLLIRQQI